MQLEMEIIAVAATVVITMMCIGIGNVVLTHLRNGSTNPTTSPPPGSLGPPIVGETLQFLWSLRSNKPQSFIQNRVNKFGHVFKTSILGQRTVVVANPPGNRLLLSNENKLVVSSWSTSFLRLMGSDALINKCGDDHKRLRVALMRTFCPESLQLVMGKMSRAIQGHLNENWKRKGDQVIKVFPAIKSLLFSVFCDLFLDLHDKHLEKQLLEICDDIAVGLVSVPMEFMPGSRYRKAKIARKRMESIFFSIILKKRRSLADDDHDANVGLPSSKCDLLSNLLAVKDERGERLSNKEILDNICFVMQAGFETTTATLTMMLKLLSSHQASYEEIVKEQMQILSSKADGEQITWNDTKKMKYTWQVVQETLRIFPPIYGSYRRAIVDIEYGGYRIPKGWKLLWTVYSTHVNEAYFTDPQQFKPSRFDKAITAQMPAYTYLPFGAGVRLCPGEEYAKMEILLFMYHFVEAFSGFSAVDPREKISINPFPTPANGFPIHLIPRVHD